MVDRIFDSGKHRTESHQHKEIDRIVLEDAEIGSKKGLNVIGKSMKHALDVVSKGLSVLKSFDGKNRHLNKLQHSPKSTRIETVASGVLKNSQFGRLMHKMGISGRPQNKRG